MAGFSKDGGIPWINEDFAKADLKRFKQLTDGNICIMGRKTYEDITNYAKEKGFLEKNKTILPNRECIVLTKKEDYEVVDGVVVKPSLRKAIEHCVETKKKIFVIGGEALFVEALSWDIDTIYVSLIHKDYECDKFFQFKTLTNRFHISKGIKTDYDFLQFIEYKPNKYRR